ncbi:MAG TPA: cation diffusion facilitator family transporter [Vicinamibacterales bacterium]|jgi:cobalt-zinc-cadmium efflux system protein|nr:cation diffusion facilitator family transporter [Vicinamibacterales bacterium]
MTHSHAGHSHAHAHGHSHGHSHAPPNVSGRAMGAAVTLTLAFVAVEAVAGWMAHSLALVSDAGHNLADAAALGFSWYALTVASKPSHQGMTFGYHRVGIFAALANAVSLVLIAAVIAWEGIERIREPQTANGPVMIGVAAAAIVINLAVGLWLHSGSKDDLNIRSAYLHMMGDALSAFGVVIAGVLVVKFGLSLADPIVSLLIAGLILYSSYGVLRESTTVLLEGTPAGMDMPAVIAAIKSVAGVLDVHDLHVWMVGPGVVACSCHILVAEQSVREGQQVLRAVVHDIEHRFNITHTTVQVEVEGCDANDMYCMGQHSSAGG